MRTNVWEILGIAQTSDERAIKRAYAAKLKVTTPERDPTGYMQLRDAYEAAKQMAKHARYAEQFAEAEGAQSEDPEQAALSQQAEQAADEPPPEPEVEGPPPTPQGQAFAELRTLLEERKFDEALRKIEAIQAAQIFATLDEQHDFIGMVALLVQHLKIQEQPWRGQLAALLGARDYDNIFPQDSGYWFAYRELLQSYAEVRHMAAHVQARDQDEFASTPGYLHVFHVLTAPFDSERLIALTRSQVYHRVAENILQRAKTDPSIVIPPENRDWWERTAMAGQHRPVEQVATSNAAPADESSSFPTWAIWPVLMLLFSSLRLCGSSGPDYSSTLKPERMEEIRQLAQDRMPIGPPSSTELLLAQDSPLMRLSQCDDQTRVELIRHMQRVRKEPTTQPDSNHRSGYLKWNLVLDESDPEVAALLAKCAPTPAK